MDHDIIIVGAVSMRFQAVTTAQGSPPADSINDWLTTQKPAPLK